jgi:hypothetical protein
LGASEHQEALLAEQCLVERRHRSGMEDPPVEGALGQEIVAIRAKPGALGHAHPPTEDEIDGSTGKPSHSPSSVNARLSAEVVSGTGIRHDRWAEANRIGVETPKPEEERGLYLHPEAWGMPAERGLASLLDPNPSGSEQERAE